MHFADPPPILPFQIDEFGKTGKARTKTGERRGDKEKKKKSLNETQGKRGKKKRNKKKQFPGQ